MPLVLVDKTSKRFKIYDKEFEVQREQKQNPNQEKKKSSDDKKVAPPPEYYPFNELDQVVEEAQVKLRLPSSLRYQIDYNQVLGQKYQSILNN